MHHVRLGVGVAVVNRLLYAAGGFDGKERLNTVECYHPENDEWTFVPPMTFARSGHGKEPQVPHLNLIHTQCFLPIARAFLRVRLLLCSNSYQTKCIPPRNFKYRLSKITVLRFWKSW